MMQILPKVVPINELKNTAQISKTCQDSNVPIIVTKNGYGEMVLMSIDLYERLFAKMQVAQLINEALVEIESGAEAIDSKVFLDDMRQKYAK